MLLEGGSDILPSLQVPLLIWELLHACMWSDAIVLQLIRQPMQYFCIWMRPIGALEQYIIMCCLLL